MEPNWKALVVEISALSADIEHLKAVVADDVDWEDDLLSYNERLEKENKELQKKLKKAKKK